MSALLEREKGVYPLSIATSLAIEGGTGAHPDNPTGENIFAGKTGIFINLRTLIRNILGAVSTADKYVQTGEDIYDVLLAEILALRGIFEPMFQSETPVLFYAMNYNSLDKRFKKILFKDVTTDKQRQLALVENTALETLKKDVEADESQYADVVFLDSIFHHDGRDHILFSSSPVDLLSLPRGEFAGLLESHTGNFKTKEMYYTKFKDSSGSERIPFDQCMIQIFGDSSNLFLCQTKQIRDKLRQIAEKYQWTAYTTKERVLLCVKLSKEPVLYDLVRSCY